MSDTPLIRLHDPPGINHGLIRRAVDIVVETCSPRTVYLVGPTATGYVEYNQVKLLVVVDEGDKKQIWGDVAWALVDVFIDGEVSVYTSEEFEECRTNSCSPAYQATKYGRIAYQRTSEHHIIDSGDEFNEHVMDAAPRVGRRDSDGMTVFPADWDDPGDEVYSAMEADEVGFACILDEGIIGAVFEEAAASGKTLYLSRICADGRIRLRIPLPVRVFRDDRWNVDPVGLPIHGKGDTPIEALESMASMLLEDIEMYCVPEVPLDDPMKEIYAAYVRLDNDL